MRWSIISSHWIGLYRVGRRQCWLCSRSRLGSTQSLQRSMESSLCQSWTTPHYNIQCCHIASSIQCGPLSVASSMSPQQTIAHTRQRNTASLARCSYTLGPVPRQPPLDLPNDIAPRKAHNVTAPTVPKKQGKYILNRQPLTWNPRSQ